MLWLIPMLALAAATTREDKDLEQAVRYYDAAQIYGDRKSLERLLADDHLLANSAGAAETDAEFIIGQ